MVKVRVLDLTSRELKDEFKKIDVDKRGLEIMLPKGKFYLLKIEGMSAINANIVKQQMLSIGGEAAVARGAIEARVDKSDCIIMGTSAQYNNLIEKLKLQPWGLKEVARKIEQTLTQFNQDKLLLCWDGYRLEFHQKTLIMGILNLTPDSFSDGGKFLKKEDALRHAQEMEKEGADIIDVGGESTRPGARTVSLEEELRRVIPLIRELRKKVRVPISIDTRKAKVAKEAIESGANIINDVSALRYDPDMLKVVKKYKVPIIVMHMKGSPRTMQRAPQYRDLLSEIYTFFERTIQKLVQEGIDESKIIIDPGIGFGKTLEHNVQILRRLREFRSLGRPILLGPSRKSFIGQILNLPVDRRLNGTLASCACAIMNGADILRVHDVREVVELAKVLDRLVR